VYAVAGADCAGHHQADVDFDENAMIGAVALLGEVAADLLAPR
jgi:hypothetical protein